MSLVIRFLDLDRGRPDGINEGCKESRWGGDLYPLQVQDEDKWDIEPREGSGAPRSSID